MSLIVNSEQAHKYQTACNTWGCCSCETTDHAIVTTCTVAGTFIGFAVPPGGPFVGALVGYGVGLTFCAIKDSVQQGKCVIL